MATTTRPSKESFMPILTNAQPTSNTIRRTSTSKNRSDNTTSSTSTTSPASSGPSFSTNSLSSTDPRVAEMRSYTDKLDRLENKRLQDQRFTLSPQQEFNMTLGAKVQRALDRRFSGQDAELRIKPKSPTVMSEKVPA